MRAIVQTRYGLGNLWIGEAPVPTPGPGQVLVEVRAAALNYATMYKAAGTPIFLRFSMGGLARPRAWIPGGELSGKVEAVGEGVASFKPGDEVYGDSCRCGYGAFAEYASVDEACLAPKPDNLSFEEAAAVPQAALVALQGLRAGGIREGIEVLVHGASGGIGSFAVQIAKAFGARVTAVCGPGNLDLVRSLGADRAIDYTKGPFLERGAYDLILAVRGTLWVGEYHRALRPDGSYVMAGASLGRYFSTSIRGPALFQSGGKKLGRFTYQPLSEDLRFMKALIEAGKVRIIIDSIHPLSEAGDAFLRLREGHARGRIILRV